jgi:hypothetical protein
VVKHLTMALVAMVIYGALHIPLGRIPVANGAGCDGIDYVAMLEKGWKAGRPNTQLRPLIVWLARPAYLVTGSAAQAFDVANDVFTGLLAFLFSLLMEWYGASSLARWVALVCISASNAYRLPAYYPVLIDLGGHAMMALAVWHIIAGPRWAAGAASIAAVPFQGMDLTRYFTEWFPSYAWTNTAPGDVTRSVLWPGWTWRFVAVSLALCALIVYANGRARSTVVIT